MLQLMHIHMSMSVSMSMYMIHVVTCVLYMLSMYI